MCTFIAVSTMSMASIAEEGYVHRHADEAISLHDKDDEVDHLWESILRETLSYMMEDPRKTALVPASYSWPDISRGSPITP